MFTSRAKTEKFTRHVFRYCERSFFSTRQHVIHVNMSVTSPFDCLLLRLH
ncbi:DUF1661 domain-containing protein [Porphyromonas gingivalis]|nr:DUF1661 domain-containing protein [Porphyromonas gingivalis]